MTYPSRKHPLRSSEIYRPPAPEWDALDLEQWLEKNVTDPDMRECIGRKLRGGRNNGQLPHIKNGKMKENSSQTQESK